MERKQVRYTFVDFKLVSLAIIVPILFSTPVHADDKVSAWFDHSNASLPNVIKSIKVMRNNKEVSLSNTTQLYACDKVTLIDLQQLVRIRLADYKSLQLDASQTSVTIPCESKKIGEKLVGVLQAVIGNSESSRQRVLGGSRQAASKGSDEKLKMPSLNADTAVVAISKNPLFLTWHGGQSPFTIELIRSTDNSIVASVNNLIQNDARLPISNAPVGQYSLVIKNADGSGIRESKFYLVETSKVPLMPTELRNAKLDEESRTLFYADYLLGFEDGRFTLQAIQQVANIMPQTKQTRVWLSAWGGNKTADN